MPFGGMQGAKPCVVHVVISLIRARTRGVEELELPYRGYFVWPNSLLLCEGFVVANGGATL